MVVQPWHSLTVLVLSHNRLTYLDDSLQILPVLREVSGREREREREGEGEGERGRGGKGRGEGEGGERERRERGERKTGRKKQKGRKRERGCCNVLHIYKLLCEKYVELNKIERVKSVPMNELYMCMCVCVCEV